MAIRACLIMLTACAVAGAQSIPLSRSVLVGAAKDFPALPSGPILNPTKCDASGAVYFRGYDPKAVYSAVITKIPKRDDKILVLDVAKADAESVAKPKSLQYNDFAIAGGIVHIPTVNEDGRAYIVRFSADDGRWIGSTTLEKGFTPAKIAVFTSGAFVVTGTLKSQVSDSDISVRHHAMLYDPSGHPVKDIGTVQLGTDSTKSAAIELSEMQEISTGLMESSGSSIYLLQPAEKPVLYAIAESGAIEAIRNLWVPGDKYTPVNMRVSDTLLLVQFVKDPVNDGKTEKYVVYDIFTRKPVLIDEFSPDLIGAFGCYDWNNGYTLLSSHAGQRRLVSGTAR